MWIDKYLSGHEMEFLIKLALCLIGGVVIGLERETKGKIAGMSTQTLVISGSMLFTLLSLTVHQGDSSRIAAQIVSGIGFLGGGIILKREGGMPANVTTAASIWFSAAIGMAIGFGWYVIALIAIVYAAIIMRLPSFRGRRFDGNNVN